MLGRDFVAVKIDVDKMALGKAVALKLRETEQGSIPWMAMLDATGEKLITSDGPMGNIGYPAEPAEIEHFIAMLNKTAKRITSDEIAQIEERLKEAAVKLRQR